MIFILTIFMPIKHIPILQQTNKLYKLIKRHFKKEVFFKWMNTTYYVHYFFVKIKTK